MTAQFDWNSFEPVNQKKSQDKSKTSSKDTENQIPSQQEQRFNWEDFESVEKKKEQQDEGLLHKTARHIARGASRAGETLLGIPGDVVKIAKSLPETPESLKREPTYLQKKGKELLEKLPGSEELRELTKEYFGGFTEPQNEYEKIGDEVIEDIASLVGPGKFKKALYVSLGANAVKQGLNKIGFSEEKQNTGKLGTLFALSMVNPKGIQNFYKERYHHLRNNTPNINLHVPGLEQELTHLENNLLKGVSVPTKSAVLKPVQELKAKIRHGNVNAEDLVQARFDVNDLMGDPELLKYGKHMFPKLSKAINKAIHDSPQLSTNFKKTFLEADQAYSALFQSKKASRFLGKLHPIKSSLVAAMIEGIHYPEALPLTVAGLATGFSVVKAYELMQRVNANPTMRKYYVSMMKNALDENKIATLRSFNQLEEKLREEDRKHPQKEKK